MSFQSPMPYRFAWDVKDDASYNNFAHSESSDGKLTTGSYRVALPDGRTQIVNYRADSYGYVADVKYEGEAKYPEYKPSNSYSARPAYNAPAAPVYRAPAAPVYVAPRSPTYGSAAAPSYGSVAAPAYVASHAPAAPAYSAPAAPVYRSPPTPVYRGSSAAQGYSARPVPLAYRG